MNYIFPLISPGDYIKGRIVARITISSTTYFQLLTLSLPLLLQSRQTLIHRRTSNPNRALLTAFHFNQLTGSEEGTEEDLFNDTS